MTKPALRIASCQFAVTGDITRNARQVRRYLKAAAEGGAQLLHTSETCLSEMTPAQMLTRCADNGLWAVANNSTRRHSVWGSLVARPDGTTARRLPQNRAGMIMHDFPDVLPKGGWLHNFLPLRLAPETPMCYGTPSGHPRQADGRSAP